MTDRTSAVVAEAWADANRVTRGGVRSVGEISSPDGSLRGRAEAEQGGEGQDDDQAPGMMNAAARRGGRGEDRRLRGGGSGRQVVGGDGVSNSAGVGQGSGWTPGSGSGLMCVGGPPKPMQPIRFRPRSTLARLGRRRAVAGSLLLTRSRG